MAKPLPLLTVRIRQNPNPRFASVDEALHAAAPALAELYRIGEEIVTARAAQAAQHSQPTPELALVPKRAANGSKKGSKRAANG